ncbi:MAG: hypothetical protein ACJ8GN_19895 [Longimicrobiaceae bacterium]
MEEREGPVHDLVTIQASVAAGDYHFEDYAMEGYSNLGFSESEVLGCIAGLTVEAHFLRSEVSTHEHFVGEEFDVYIFHPHELLKPNRGVWLKLVLSGTHVKIFSAHESKVPRRLRK